MSVESQPDYEESDEDAETERLRLLYEASVKKSAEKKKQKELNEYSKNATPDLDAYIQSKRKMVEAFCLKNNINTSVIFLATTDLVAYSKYDKESVYHSTREALVEELYNAKPKIPTNKGTYTQAHKRAQQKYREKNRAEYNEQQHKVYEKNKVDAEWKKRFNERSKENNKIYRQKKNEEKLSNPNYEPKKRGRPRKDISTNLLV
jgi:hypothetical protein